MGILGDMMSRIFRGSTLARGAAAETPALPGGPGGPGGAEAGQAGGQAPSGMAPPATGAAPPPLPMAPAGAGPAGGDAAATVPAAGPAGTPAQAGPPAVDVEAMLAAMAAAQPQRLDWRRSIVDLMKLLGMDSSLAARKELAQELGYGGTLDGSAEMNLWLHRAVMRRVAEHGGRVPPDLLD